ncbi:hypothetical protein O1611_g5623 [Lasiodiplodia mahajangana]|uniref:Uncharacterized protein n=1 Tax=Lasiodiplodia mahajangana TaxID=1108764 RepID=A0ACC2JKH4_9PEZI|nr:hypothetical protein O1611_g5623 [Lasiodiplodia mahajangana]
MARPVKAAPRPSAAVFSELMAMGVKGKPLPKAHIYSPSGPVRRRNAADDQGSGERIALLESKLECLVSQLQSRETLGDGGGSTSTAVEPSPEQPGASLVTPSPSRLHRNVAIKDVDVNPSTEAPVTSLTKPPDAIAALLHPSPAVAAPIATDSETLDDDQRFATCLDTFTSSMLPFFPFIHFPSSLTVERLRRDRPLLLHAIVCVAWPSSREKRARALELKRTLLEAVFMRSQNDSDQSREAADSSIDALLALLTYVAWGWDHLHSRNNLSYLMMSCMSLVGEMFLDRPAPLGLHTSDIFAPHSETQRDTDEPSSERQRALLGCFVLSSVVSSFFGSMDAMNWTPQMEVALETMSTNQECPSDAVLVLQVRLQILYLEATKLRDGLQEQPSHTQSAPITASVTRDAERLLQQLQNLRKSSSMSSEHNHEASLAHMSYVEMRILDTIRAPSLILSQFGGDALTAEPRSSDESGGGLGQNIPSSDHGDPRYTLRSIPALKTCTSTLLSIPPSRFRAISFIQWGQLADCLVVLSHLDDILVNIPNSAFSRGIIDSPVLLDRIIEKLTLTAEEALEEDNEGIFTLLASRNGGSGSDRNNQASVRPVRPSQGPFQNPQIWIDQLFAA